MRVLFSSTGGDGHLLPLLPLAGAFLARGDDVIVAAPATHRDRVERAGFRFAAVGPTVDDLRVEIAAHRDRLARVPLSERRAAAFSGRFGTIEAPHRIGPLRTLIGSRAPDVVISEPADLAAPIAALEAEVPFVYHSFGRSIPEAALRMAADVLAPLRRVAGLEPDPLAGAYRGSFVDICPPALRTPLPDRPVHTHALRPVDAPEQAARAGDRPVVYATLGTVFNDLAIFRLLLDALETIDCDVVMTIGRNRSASDLAPIPRNATVSSYIPQAEILEACDAVIAHGGSGSLLAALAYGRPLVLLPQGADQFDNAGACATLGLAEVILPAEITVDRVRDAVDAVLTNQS